MSIRRRVEALEAASGMGFRVAWTVLLDRRGNRFEAKPLDSEVAGLRVCVESACVEVRRESNESLPELEKRAHVVASRLGATVILPFYAEFI